MLFLICAVKMGISFLGELYVTWFTINNLDHEPSFQRYDYLSIIWNHLWMEHQRKLKPMCILAMNINLLLASLSSCF